MDTYIIQVHDKHLYGQYTVKAKTATEARQKAKAMFIKSQYNPKNVKTDIIAKG